MRTYMKMSPLSPEEQAFAAENHPFVLWYIKDQNLDFDQYYDVVIMGFLKAVKNWFARPELHKHSFTVIAKWSMMGYMSCERKKEQRQIQTISLDEMIPGTDGCTYGESITYDNLNYLKENNMKISYNVTVPERRRIGAKSDEMIAIEGFIIGKMKNMCFEYETIEEAKKKAASIQSTRRKMNHQNIYEAFRNENRVYIVRNLGKTGK